MTYRVLILLFALSGLLGGSVHAQDDDGKVYISDMLRVGVRPEPDSRVTPVGVVTTGMHLEVLARRDGYIRIRTDKGLTGWIRDIYTTEEPPAMIRLEQVREQRAAMEKELTELRQAVNALEEANQTLNSQLDELKAERSKLQLRVARSAAQTKKSGSTVIFWVIGLVLIGIAAFAGGVVWQRYQTSRRLGGLRF
ncbi:TIGR04211 family SH3 domain-containing protein [Thiohalophilus sp.]|uniref:TIGR04211 family SH3 domain-containing protein n=1 Tax=Thiohalophilus sp. TaxID=3028392 RepID=UPI002ACDF8AD|nr:TIGR04211 family SH3 domain-containing protein [Thiohalophilus sp.]MDZ7805413.1 TIGR04211 family SH3 domain-containing protein [Thiohalophilus sp.]